MKGIKKNFNLENKQHFVYIYFAIVRTARDLFIFGMLFMGDNKNI